MQLSGKIVGSTCWLFDNDMAQYVCQLIRADGKNLRVSCFTITKKNI